MSSSDIHCNTPHGWPLAPFSCYMYMYMFLNEYVMYNIHMYMKPCSQLCYAQCTSLVTVFRDVGEAVVGLT